MRLPKRLVALLLLVACLAAFALPVSAKTFTDLEDHWAKSYMEDLYDRGYLTGYTDNTMRPDEMITACETLVLLSRFYNLTDTEAAYLYEDYGELVEEMVPEDKSWAYDEIALCLAAGIVTEKELGQLDMSLPVAKEYLGVCIIRAMQLTDEAEAFTQSLTFEDTDKIASAYQGYIALLVDMGVVTGDTNNRFNPRSGVSRAVCATMISRALEYAQEQEKIKSLGENRVLFLPYLMGERSPHNDPDARAMFLGMSMDTTREDMTQAVLEGVAFGLRDSLEVARSLGIRIERSKICGGGAKSPLWKKILAAVLNLKLDLIESEEGPGYGGAILAAVGCGEYESVQAACEKLVHVVDTVEPDPVLVEKYEARYQEFRKLYPAVKALFPFT